jgi:hypothetical protein
MSVMVFHPTFEVDTHDRAVVADRCRAVYRAVRWPTI